MSPIQKKDKRTDSQKKYKHLFDCFSSKRIGKRSVNIHENGSKEKNNALVYNRMAMCFDDFAGTPVSLSFSNTHARILSCLSRTSRHLTHPDRSRLPKFSLVDASNHDRYRTFSLLLNIIFFFLLRCRFLFRRPR